MNLTRVIDFSSVIGVSIVGFFTLPFTFASSIASGNLIEDFTDIGHWDAANSTGLWNIVDHAAQAGRVTGGAATQSISFGDGSDGVLNSTTGYTFDTDQHPQGFNFISVNITAGTIQVKGSQPLIIRSLSTINFVPALSVRGGNGVSGAANGSTTGPAGGVAVASKCSGGKGGAPANTPSGDGGTGLTFNGTSVGPNGPESPGGTGQTGGTNPAAASAAFDSPEFPNSNPWETPANFRCGAGGGGGGGHINGGNYSTGGAGGAGGGTVRLIATGSITWSSIDAGGGDGGTGTNDGQCSGSGAGGNGGAVWIQTLQTTTGPTPTFGGGNGSSSPCGNPSFNGLDGFQRTDTATTSSAAGLFATGDVAAAQTYTIQSKAYDLGTRNAGFLSAPVVGTILNGGTVALTYSGSADGTTFSSPTTDIAQLSNLNFRYVKFKLSVTTAATTGPSPQVQSITIPFSELSIELAGGCGTISRKRGDPPKSRGLALEALLWLALCFIGKCALGSSRRLPNFQPDLFHQK